MASTIHILDSKGKPLLSRNYKGDIPVNAVEKFPLLLIEAEEESSAVPPVMSHNGINYLYITHNDLYLLAMSKNNDNATEILLFLHRIVEVLTQYFKELQEESIRDNFVIIYELLDEMMDFGHPQTTDTKILKEYITQESHALESQVRPPVAVTNAVSWRSEGIMYKKNEAFLDVIESVNMLINSTGQVLRSEIIGKIEVKSHLSGMPDLRLGLNDRGLFGGRSATSTNVSNNQRRGVEMEDVKFHQCVRLSKFETEKIITFIPPDGEFELMSYRLTAPVKPLIYVDCRINKFSNSRIEINAIAKAQIKSRSSANNVEILIPVPPDADSPKFKSSGGKLTWLPEKSAILWKFKSFGGGKEFSMFASLGLPSVQVADDPDYNKAKRPISVKFEIPYFTTSGLQVRYLRINEPKLQYQSFPWVRYITQSGDDYTIRI